MLTRWIVALAACAAMLCASESPAQADYFARWQQLGGSWSWGPVRVSGDANVCVHNHPGCTCQNRNYCGTYRHNDLTTWCPNGANRGPAWRIQCLIRPVAGTGPGTGQTRRINNPTINGATVDWCAPWAQNCGMGAATTYCRSIGYARAVDFATSRPGRTWVMGSNRYCTQPSCGGFSHVTCAR